MSVEPAEATDSTEPPPAKRLKDLAALLKHIEEESEQSCSASTLTHSQVIDKEISSYLDFPGAESDTDPLA